MRHRIQIITAIALEFLAYIGHARTVRPWDFDTIDDREVWEVTRDVDEVL